MLLSLRNHKDGAIRSVKARPSPSYDVRPAAKGEAHRSSFLEEGLCKDLGVFVFWGRSSE